MKSASSKVCILKDAEDWSRKKIFRGVSEGNSLTITRIKTEQEEMIWMLLIFTISNCGFTLARKYSTGKTNFHILSLVVKNYFTVRPLIHKTDKISCFDRFSITILSRKLVSKIGDFWQKIKFLPKFWSFRTKYHQFSWKLGIFDWNWVFLNDSAC